MHAEPELQPDPAGALEPVRRAPGRQVAVVDASSPAGMLAYAMKAGATIAELRDLYALKQEWDKDEARKAYHLALADFKAEPLVITKDKRVYFESKDGTSATDYMHATLGGVVRVIAPALAKHRLSHSWDVQRDGERIRVVCKLTHALGHSESIMLEGPLDNSGKKNAIQQQASTITYLERYTLLAITGLATEDSEDDDGRGATRPQVECITEEQAATLLDILTEANASVPAFLEWAKAPSLGQIEAAHWETVHKVAKQKLSAARKAGGR
jgi:hypothetical protein